jgi:hypothetical protein
MSDAGIKNIIIEKNDLPEIYGTHQEYLLRYRIISDDRNRSSHWSPQYKLAISNISTINYSISVNQDSKVISLVWDSVKDISEYYIYVKWDNQNWEYLTSSNSNSYSTLIKTGSSHVKFAIQPPTFPKERFSGLTFFETVSTNL